MRVLAARTIKLTRVACVAALLVFVWNSALFSQTRKGSREEWNSVVAKAKQEGRVVVWSTPGQLLRQGITEGFGKAYPGISLEYSGARGGEHATKLSAERNAGLYNVDVLLTGADTHSVHIKPLKALDPLRPALILPEVTDVKNWRDNRLEFIDVEQQYVIAFVSMPGDPVAYNLDQVKPQEINKLYDLLAPKWKGKIIVSDPTTPGTTMGILNWLWHTLGEEKAVDYYKRLREQTALVSRDWRRLFEWVVQGRYPILLGPSRSVGSQLYNEGLRFGWLFEFEDHGTFLSTSAGNVGLINRAPNPNAAKVFINWLLGKEGQTIWSKALNHTSRRVDVPTDHLPEGSLMRPGGKYWKGYLEQFIVPPAEETRIVKELFGK
jgi:iron(III) transport system substrate-binding protein